jgi:hypothetical protein
MIALFKRLFARPARDGYVWRPAVNRDARATIALMTFTQN